MDRRQPAIALTGPPGSGKSSTGRELASLMGAALLDLDTLTNPLVDVLLDALGGQSYDDDTVAPVVRAARYECLVRAAEDCLRVGIPVVLVAPFTAERRDGEVWAALAGRLTEAGGDPHLVWLRIAAGELRQRLRLRQAARDHAKLQQLDRYVTTIDLSPPEAPHLSVDAVETPARQAQTIQRRLPRHPLTRA